MGHFLPGPLSLWEEAVVPPPHHVSHGWARPACARPTCAHTTVQSWKEPWEERGKLRGAPQTEPRAQCHAHFRPAGGTAAPRTWLCPAPVPGTKTFLRSPLVRAGYFGRWGAPDPAHRGCQLR